MPHKARAMLRKCWITVYFARPYDLKLGAIKDLTFARKVKPIRVQVGRSLRA